MERCCWCGLVLVEVDEDDVVVGRGWRWWRWLGMVLASLTVFDRCMVCLECIVDGGLVL